MAALQTHFLKKRDHVMDRLIRMGFHFPKEKIPDSTFYIWLDLSPLPEKIRDGLGFFEECLKEKVICVPGMCSPTVTLTECADGC